MLMYTSYACHRETKGRVPPISVALAEARLQKNHPEALFHVQRRIPQLKDSRLLVAASRQVSLPSFRCLTLLFTDHIMLHP
jgi:hypothetical protein